MSPFLRGFVRGADPRRGWKSCLAIVVVAMCLPSGMSVGQLVSTFTVTVLVLVALCPLYGESHTPEKKEKP